MAIQVRSVKISHVSFVFILDILNASNKTMIMNCVLMNQ